MKIFIIRHAESDNNKNWFFNHDDTNRSNDPAISDLGKKQADCLRAFLQDHLEEFDFTRIYISPFLRTLQTAAFFHHLYDVPKVVWKPIHENGGCVDNNIETGEWTGASGMGRSEIVAKFPHFEVSDEIDESGWWNRPVPEPRGERGNRAQQVIMKLTQKFEKTNEHIALVSHGGFHPNIINALIGINSPNDSYRYWFEAQNTGITCFVYGNERGDGFNPDEWRIDYVNRHEWLPKELRRN